MFIQHLPSRDVIQKSVFSLDAHFQKMDDPFRLFSPVFAFFDQINATPFGSGKQSIDCSVESADELMA